MLNVEPIDRHQGSLVSAIMLTGRDPERYPLAQVAIRCFLEQTYPVKELVIINQGAALMPGGHDKIREFCIGSEETRTTGDLRNLGLSKANGEFVIGWDDDDWYHPDRIGFQLKNYIPGAAVILRRQIRLNLLNGNAFCFDSPGGIDGTILHARGAGYRYQSLNRREDTEFLDQFDSIIVTENDPLLYVRTFHGHNLWDGFHIMGRYSSPHLNDRVDLNSLQERELKKIRETIPQWDMFRRPLSEAINSHRIEKIEPRSRVNTKISYRFGAGANEPKFAAVTCYFNPSGSQSLLSNYAIFSEYLKKCGCPLYTVELAFHGAAFNLTKSEHVFHVRSNSILWHKEALLNLAVKNLPNSISKIAWLDCDIMFSNPQWHLEAAKELDRFPVLQLFRQARKLSRTGDVEKMQPSVPFAIFQGHRHPFDFGQVHPGFAWAMRRDYFEEFGLFDCDPIGSSDVLMVYAFFGQLDAPRLNGYNHQLRSAFYQWARPVWKMVKGNVGFLNTDVMHFWHGDDCNRNYIRRLDYIKTFDPNRHVLRAENGLWAWSQDSIEIEEKVRAYFAERREDG